MAAKHSNEYKKLKTDLLNDLAARGLTGTVFVDKVNEYMDLWERRKQLAEQIGVHGVTIESARGTVENRMVSLEMQCSKQMLAIFKALGFQSRAVHRTAVDDDDLDL